LVHRLYRFQLAAIVIYWLLPSGNYFEEGWQTTWLSVLS